MQLPYIQSAVDALNQMQTKWRSILNPLLALPQPIILKNVALINGTTVINHQLGRTLQGWNPVRVRASATIYDTQDSNQTPQVTLVLVSNAAVVVDLEVF